MTRMTYQPQSQLMSVQNQYKQHNGHIFEEKFQENSQFELFLKLKYYFFSWNLSCKKKNEPKAKFLIFLLLMNIKALQQLQLL